MRRLPEFKISYKSRHKESPLVSVNSPETAADVCRSLFSKGTIAWKEEFHVVGLTKNHHVIGSFKTSDGGVTGTVADPKVIMQFALLINAPCIIITHNHPSGNVTASSADKEVTEKIRKACEYLDMQLIDHIIITPDSYGSFSEMGLL